MVLFYIFDMTKSFKTQKYEHIVESVKSFVINGRPTLSNYYGIPQGFLYQSLSTDCSLIIKQHNSFGFARLYFLTRDVYDLADTLNSMADMTYLFNIPVKNDLGVWGPLLDKIKYYQYGKYHRYSNNNIRAADEILHSIANEDRQIELEGYKLCERATMSNFAEVQALLLDTFDIYTDYLPSDNQLKCMIDGNRVYINLTPEGNVCGVAVFENIGIKCYQNFWIDKRELGLYLMRKMYDQMVENSISFTNLWVADWNKSVIKLHKMLGALPDGMIDYTFKSISNMSKK